MAEQLQINIGANTQQLEAGLDRAEKAVVQFDKSVAKTTSSSGQATLALSNLGRVASDAPFGFIAIANNIEPLIQSFQSLNKSSGGTGAALKALAGSLAGPGGVLLAFSVVSSAVTVAIQKYGSLGNAVNALFGKYDPLIKQIQDAADSYAKFNKELKTTEEIQSQAGASVQGEITRVQSLASIVTDQTKSYSDRNQALKDLQAINKTYFGNIDLEKSKLTDVTGAVEAYTKATIQAAVTKGFESEIGKVSVELAKQELVLRKLQERLEDTRRAPVRIVGAAATVDTRDIREAEAAFNAQAKVVNELQGQYKQLGTEIDKSQKSYNAIVAPITTANDLADKQKKAQEAAAAATKKKNEETKREIELERKRIERLDQRLANAETLRPVVGLGFEIDDKNLEDNLSRLKVAYQDGLKKFTSVGDQIVNTIPKLPKDFQLLPSESLQNALNGIEQFKIKFQESVAGATAAFNTVLAPAIDAVFSAIENGENVISSLGNAFKRLVVDLVKATIKAAALAAIISVVTGTPFAGNFRAVSGIGNAGAGGGGLGGIFRGGTAAPTFGGVQGFGGGLQLAGQVVFRQQGADLVGVLNSSNARINRVG